MLRSTLFTLTLAIAGITSAQLAPDAAAPIALHMLEVNAEWSTMDRSALDDAHPVRFTSESERIATHLHHVAERLSASPSKELTSATLLRRQALLDTLQAYADRGRFPLNTSVPGRIPVFIDELGTACAVGQLMISSGHAGLAERISNEMNLAYIHDIALPEVGTWAATHGFTADELAWIQPTYEHMMIRDPNLLATVHLMSGERFEVRSPADAKAGQKLHLIRKDPQGDKVVASLPALSGVKAIEFEGRVFVGGTPPQAGSAAEVYEWNGSSLVAHDPFTGRTNFAGFFLKDGALHARSYLGGENAYQDRYLTPIGEWKVTSSYTEPIKSEQE